jgi:multidrug efflux pump subunit AcrB
MIRAIVRSSLRFRLLVLGIAAGVMVAGITQLRDAPTDVLPEFTPPYVEVQTEALGLSAEEVEQLITVPLEADLLNGVQGVETIRSESLPGLSSITLVFKPGTDVYRARQLVQEPLQAADDAAAAVLVEPRDDDRPVLGQALADREVGDRALDDAPPPDGRAGRRERIGVRHAGPADPGAGRPGPAPRPKRAPEPDHQHCW